MKTKLLPGVFTDREAHIIGFFMGAIALICGLGLLEIEPMPGVHVYFFIIVGAVGTAMNATMFWEEVQKEKKRAAQDKS